MAGNARQKPLSRIAGEGGSPESARRVRVLKARQPIAPSPPPSPPLGARGFFGTPHRRTVIAGIAAALMPGPLAAQPQGGMRRLGVLMANADGPLGQTYTGALVQGLGALGWKEGNNLRTDWRWAGGDPALFERYAAELVALGPNAVVAHGSPSVAALLRLTKTIPIVFVVVTDPVGQGFVASLARPGGTVTGFSDYDPPMSGKLLGMLTQIAPPVARVAVLYNPATAPFADLVLRAVEAAAPPLGVAVRGAPVHDDAEIEATMAGLARETHGGLLVVSEAFTASHRGTIVDTAARYRVPAVYPDKFYAPVGGLIAYGTDKSDLFRRSAAYIDRILKGEKPADLPVQNPTKFELVLNLKTAQALGVTFPPSLLAGADEVVE